MHSHKAMLGVMHIDNTCLACSVMTAVPRDDRPVATQGIASGCSPTVRRRLPRPELPQLSGQPRRELVCRGANRSSLLPLLRSAGSGARCRTLARRCSARVRMPPHRKRCRLSKVKPAAAHPAMEGRRAAQGHARSSRRQAALCSRTPVMPRLEPTRREPHRGLLFGWSRTVTHLHLQNPAPQRSWLLQSTP